MNERSKTNACNGLQEVFWTTAAAAVMPVVGVAFAARGALVGLSRLRRGGARGAGGALLAVAMLAMLAQIGHAQYIKALLGGREKARQTACTASLRAIGAATLMYAADFSDQYPSLADQGEDSPSTYTADPSAYEKLQDLYAKGASCNLQHVWLMVEQDFLPSQILKCPSDKDYKAPAAPKDKHGFDSWRNSSYAFQPFTRSRKNKAYPGIMGQDSTFVLAADKQTPRGALGGNLNHKTFLIRVHMDGSAAGSETRTNDVGVGGNNVFVRDMSDEGKVQSLKAEQLGKLSGVLPGHKNDSALFWKDDGEKVASSQTPEDATEGETTPAEEDDERPSWRAAATRGADSDIAEEGRTKALPQAAPAPQPSDTPIWTILLICLGIGAVIGVGLAIWWTAREKKAKP